MNTFLLLNAGIGLAWGEGHFLCSGHVHLRQDLSLVQYELLVSGNMRLYLIFPVFSHFIRNCSIRYQCLKFWNFWKLCLETFFRVETLEACAYYRRSCKIWGHLYRGRDVFVDSWSNENMQVYLKRHLFYKNDVNISRISITGYILYLYVEYIIFSNRNKFISVYL